MAHRGTIFLDEIAELSPHVQVKLLRILEDRQVRRVGGERPVRVDVRVMAATNRDLEAELRARRFRSDLYFRLAVVTLTVPPLRERRDDIPLLARHYLDQFRAALSRPVASISPDAVDALVSYDWPGNVRELINVVERAVLLSHGTELGLADLPPPVIAGRRVPGGPDALAAPLVDPAWFERPLLDARARVVAAFERRYLERLLAATGGRIATTAERAGVNPRTLFDVLQRHGLDKKAFRRA
jgi:DNA-binding NtrC family response regulator